MEGTNLVKHHLWPTPILVGQSELSQEILKELDGIALIIGKEKIEMEHPIPSVDGQIFRKSYNLFSSRSQYHDNVSVQTFRKYVNKIYRRFLAEEYHLKNSEELVIKARCFVNYMEKGQRQNPHAHPTADHVLVLYLNCGENRPNPKSLPERSGDAELVLQDPRPFSGFPYWGRLRSYHTNPGLVVLHPSGLWHETNTMTADGYRTVLVVTLKVSSHNYTEIYEPL